MSDYPVDQLIAELVQIGRTGTTVEVEQIIERMATAPFEPRVLPVPAKDSGLTYIGRTLGPREESLVQHLFKRVVTQEQ